MPRKTFAAALAALTIAAIPTAAAGAGTRWSAAIPSDEQAEQVVTVGVHPFPGSGAAPGTYRPGAPRWTDTWYVRLPGDTDYLVGPYRTGGPEFREIVVPAGALLEVGWGGDVYLVDAGACAGPDVNLLDYSTPHFNVPAVPLSEGRTSVSVTCTTPPPAPPATTTPPAPPVTTTPTPPPATTPPIRQLLPPTVIVPTAPTVPATPAPTVPEMDLTTTVRAARPELPVTGSNHTGLFAAAGLTMTGLGVAVLRIANRRKEN